MTPDFGSFDGSFQRRPKTYGVDGATKPDTRHLITKGKVRRSRGRTVVALCEECGRRCDALSPHSVQTADGAWETVERGTRCANHPLAQTFEISRSLGLAIEYVRRVWLGRVPQWGAGMSAVDRLLEEFNDDMWPGTSLGEVALATSYWRRWERHEERHTVVFPTAEVRLYG